MLYIKKLNNISHQTKSRVKTRKYVFTNGLRLQKTIKEINQNVICSFGEKYNSYMKIYLREIKILIYSGKRTSPLSSLK